MSILACIMGLNFLFRISGEHLNNSHIDNMFIDHISQIKDYNYCIVESMVWDLRFKRLLQLPCSVRVQVVAYKAYLEMS